jgi:hypothetical protein
MFSQTDEMVPLCPELVHHSIWRFPSTSLLLAPSLIAGWNHGKEPGDVLFGEGEKVRSLEGAS